MEVELMEVAAHMHLRGKAMTLSAVYPTNEREELLRVPNYDFSWQLMYQFSEVKKLPRGTILSAEGTFDNSPNNRHNPDPESEVRWGDQSWEEMMVGNFVIALPVTTNPRGIFILR